MKLFITVLIGSLIGWITNYIAIKMLFRPYKEWNFGLFKIQGLIPKRKNEIGKGIAEVIENELISVKDVLTQLNSEEFSGKLEDLIDEIMNKNLKAKIKELFPFMQLFLTDNVINEIKRTIKEIVLENKTSILEFFSNYLEEKVDFVQIVEEKIYNFSLEKTEEIIFSLAKKELKHIELIGAVLGAVIGFFQYLVFIFV